MKIRLISYNALAFLALSAILSGCQDYIFEAPEPVRESFYKSIQNAVKPPKTDILFVIDSSGSMSQEQAKLSENLGRFIVKLAESSNDYQIGVITPDITTTEGHQTSTGVEVEPAELVATTSGVRILKAPRPGAEYNTPEKYEAKKKELQKELICNFKQVASIQGGGQLEQALEAIRRAFSSPLNSPPRTDEKGKDIEGTAGVNYGFLRDDASLVIIIVSDEEDCSHQDSTLNPIPDEYEWGETCYPFEDPYPVEDPSTGECTADQVQSPGDGQLPCDGFTPANQGDSQPACICTNYSNKSVPKKNECLEEQSVAPLVSVDKYVSFILSQKGNKQDQVNVAVIVAADIQRDESGNFVDATAANCCNIGIGIGRKGARYIDFAKKVNPKSWRADNICLGDYRCTLLQVAAIINASSFYKIDSAPSCPNFMQVTVTLGEEIIDVQPKGYPGADNPQDADYSAWIYIPPEYGGPGIKFEGKAKIYMELGATLQLDYAENTSMIGCGGVKYDDFMQSPAISRETQSIDTRSICEQEIQDNVTCE